MVVAPTPPTRSLGLDIGEPGVSRAISVHVYTYIHARIDDARCFASRSSTFKETDDRAKKRSTDDIDAETRISRIERRRQRQQRVWFPARKRTPQRASSLNSVSSLGLGISIACLFLEASRAKCISFSSYVRSSFDSASMSRRTFSTSEASQPVRTPSKLVFRKKNSRDPTFRS